MNFLLTLIFILPVVNKPVVSLNYGAGDWSIYEHWLTNDRSCYNFIDSQPYDLARVRLEYEPTSKAFHFGDKLNILECAQLAAMAEKILILHTNTSYSEIKLNILGEQLGDAIEAVWLFYDLPMKWIGHLSVKPLRTVIIGFQDQPQYKYTDSDLEIFQQRLSQFSPPTKKGIELNSDLLKRSTQLNWTSLIDSVDYTIIFKENKTGVSKDAILDIIRSPIHATIWDTEKLDSYGTSKSGRHWPQDVVSKFVNRLKSRN